MRKFAMILVVIASLLTACGGGDISVTDVPQKTSVSLKKEAVAQYAGYGKIYWQGLYLPLAEIVLSPAQATCKSIDVIIDGAYAAKPDIYLASNGKDITGSQYPIMGGIKVSFASPINIGNGSTVSVFVSMPNSLANEQYLFKAKGIDCDGATIEGMPLSLGLVNITSYGGIPPK